MYLSIPQEVLTQKRSVGIVSLFTLRVWTPFHTNKQLPHAKPVYIIGLYIWQA